MTQHPDQQPQQSLNDAPTGPLTAVAPQPEPHRPIRRGWIVTAAIVVLVATLAIVYSSSRSKSSPLVIPPASSAPDVTDKVDVAEVGYVGVAFLGFFDTAVPEACTLMSAALKADRTRVGGLCDIGVPTPSVRSGNGLTEDEELGQRICPQGIAGVLMHVGTEATTLTGKYVAVTLRRDAASPLSWVVDDFVVIPPANATTATVLGQLCETGKVGGTT